MKIEKQHTYEKVILGLELIGFGSVVAILWLDEYVDVPFRFFGAPKTPPRPQEFWFETIAVLPPRDGSGERPRSGFFDGCVSSRISSRSAPGAARWKWPMNGSLSSNT